MSTSADVVLGSVVGTNPLIKFSHSLVHLCVGRCSLIDGLVSGVPSDWLKSCRPLNNSCSKILSDSVTSVSVSSLEGTKTLSSWEISFGFRMGPILEYAFKLFSADWIVRRIAETSSSLFVSARCLSIVNIFFRLGLSMDCADFRSFHDEFNVFCVRRNSSFRYVTLVDCSFSFIRRLRCLMVFFRSRTFVPVCDRISEKLYFVWLWQHCLSAESIYCVSSLSMFWYVCLSLLEIFCVCLHFSCRVTKRWCRLLRISSDVSDIKHVFVVLWSAGVCCSIVQGLVCFHRITSFR